MNTSDKNIRSLYENIMKEVAKTVKRRLNEAEENGTTKNLEQRDKIFMSIFNVIKRLRFDKNQLTELEPDLKESADLLDAYISGLLIMGFKCPKSLKDVENIGIFKEYLYKYIDISQFSFDSLKERYENAKKRYSINFDKIGASKRFLENELAEIVFTDASQNNVVAEKYKDTFKTANNRIGMIMTIKDGDRDVDDETEFKLWISGNNLNEVLFKYTVICQASIMDMSERFFEVDTTKVGKVLYRMWNNSLSNEEENKLDDKIHSFYKQVFEPSKTVEELIEKMKKFKFK